jgi:drug/metabolite transporter (DMT)-like permease
MQSKKDRIPHAAVLAANLFFGVNFSAVQYMTSHHMSAFAINLTRVLASVFLFWLLILFFPISDKGIQRKDWARLFVCALTGIVINQLLFIKGLSMTLSIHAALLILVTPIFIHFAAIVTGQEKFTWRVAMGVGLGVGGATILALGKQHNQTASQIWLGDLYIVINAISYAFYFVWVKPLMQTYSSVHIMRWLFTLGLPFMIVFGGQDLMQVDFNHFQGKDWAILSMIVIGATFLAYLFNIYGIKKLGAGTTGMYIYTQPIFATLIGVFILGEKITLTTGVAALIIVTGVWLVTSQKRDKA